MFLQKLSVLFAKKRKHKITEIENRCEKKLRKVRLSSHFDKIMSNADEIRFFLQQKNIYEHLAIYLQNFLMIIHNYAGQL